ncbi:universal stress protein [soil metagenome]
MNYASVMVYMDDHAVEDGRLALATEIAIRFDARVLGILGSPADSPAIDTYTGGAMLGEMMTLFRDVAEADVKKAELSFWKGAGDDAARFEWRGAIGHPCDVVGHAMRAADLIILGRRDPHALSAHAIDPGDLLMTAGRPLLIAPPHRLRGPIGEPAVVAWTDSREARRAVQAALPMLKAASRVHVVEVAAEDGLEAAHARAADVADFLSRHGIVAGAQAVKGDGSARCEQIIGFAQDTSAGLIVAGGYGHARMREWVLGGVTHGLLANSPVCLIVSH